MGLRTDIDRYEKVGEENREDLTDFIKYGDLGESTEKDISIPIKIVDLPEFVYSDMDRGGIAQAPDDADPQPGDPVDIDDGQAGEDAEEASEDGDEDGEPGEEDAQPDFYDMDPEEFARELDEELGLDLEPKGKKVVEEKEGAMTDQSRTGPSSMLDVDKLFREGLKRKMAMDFDEDYLRELLKVDGVGPSTAFDYAREKNIPVSLGWFEAEYKQTSETGKYDSIEEFEEENEEVPTPQRLRDEGQIDITFRKEDERYRHPEVVKEKESQVVIFNIRDVSGSMRQKKRDLVQRTMAPLDWYIHGKYDDAIIVYIAHNADAWEVDRVEFFGLQSGGGTQISSAYKLVDEMLKNYNWSEWNRYVFAAGDGENRRNDSEDEVVPLIENMDANLHAYIETNPSSNSRAVHGDILEDNFDEDEVTVARVNNEDDVIDAIKKILENA